MKVGFEEKITKFFSQRRFFRFSVCTKVLTDAMAKVPEAEKSKPDVIARVIREHCKDSKSKDHKLVSVMQIIFAFFVELYGELPLELIF